MYPNLNAEMARKEISVKTLSEITRINERVLRNKLSGVTDWKWNEVLKIKKVFDDVDIYFLFENKQKAG